jgi:nicotinate-nucleotide pyrophosphorylase (carboxylating)
MSSPLLADLALTVTRALAEDIGTGDVTARLVRADQRGKARVIAREPAVLCGRPWVDEVFRQIDADVAIAWQAAEGAHVEPEQVLFTVEGASRSLLTGERTALNFLQALSGTATETGRYVEAVRGTGAQIVDTRKTLPGLRNAQKYAVGVGGGVNHRIGLYDGILIKENHIAAAGGIVAAIAQARALGANVPLMVEAESLDEARSALAQDVDVLLVDDFDTPQIREAVALARDHRGKGGRTLIEYSGGATLARIRELAECGVDRISIGSLTKHVHAIDLSMRFL